MGSSFATGAPPVVWEAVRQLVVDGVLPESEIARLHGMSVGRLRQVAALKKWPLRTDVEPVPETAPDPADAEVRISLPGWLAEGLPVSLREAAVAIPVAVADAHPEFGKAIARVKYERVIAVQNHSKAVQANLAAVAKVKRVQDRLIAIAVELAELAHGWPDLAVNVASVTAPVSALVESDNKRAALELERKALTAALPTIEAECRQVLSGNEHLAHRVSDLTSELAEIRAEAAVAIAKGRQ